MEPEKSEEPWEYEGKLWKHCLGCGKVIPNDMKYHSKCGWGKKEEPKKLEDKTLDSFVKADAKAEPLTQETIEGIMKNCLKKSVQIFKEEKASSGFEFTSEDVRTVAISMFIESVGRIR